MIKNSYIFDVLLSFFVGLCIIDVSKNSEGENED